MSLKEVFKKNLCFFIPYSVLLILFTIPLIMDSKASIHIYINQHHRQSLDFVFRYLTYLGDGWLSLIIAALFLMISIRNSLFVFLTFIGGGLLVQILKRALFSGALRPVKYFDGVYELYLVEGVEMRSYLSFPSGHAATAFGLFLCLAVIARSKTVKLFCFLLAALAAFSRVYLSQHFLVDIYFGSMIGVVFTLLFYRILFSSGKKWLDHRILFH